MRRVLFAIPLLLLAACSDSSNESGTSSAPQAPYMAPGGPAGPAGGAPLTQADIDLYIAISMDAAKAPKTPEGLKNVLEKHGATEATWGSLWSRVREAKLAIVRLEKRGEAIPANLQGDVEMIKANKEKLEQAAKGQ